MRKYLELMNKLDYDFKNIHLLEEALTHPSLNIHENSKDYERLEFVGDAVLELAVTKMLIEAFPKDREGSLAKKRAALVCKDWLANKARMLDLGDIMIMTKSEEDAGGRDNSSNLSNTLEAILGSIYLDSGSFDRIFEIIAKYWQDDVINLIDIPNDPKSAVQEWVQGKKYKNAVYEVIDQRGPPHNPVFTVKLTIPGIDIVEVESNSKKNAEREAAKAMLLKLKERNLL